MITQLFLSKAVKSRPYLSKKWKSDLVGQSTGSVSIEPNTINVNTAMLRGVPINGNKMDILSHL